MERKIAIFFLCVCILSLALWNRHKKVVEANKVEIVKETKISEIRWQDDNIIMKPSDFEKE